MSTAVLTNYMRSSNNALQSPNFYNPSSFGYNNPIFSFNLGTIDPYYGHTAEEWKRLSPKERQEAQNKYYQDQIDARNARATADAQAQNGVNGPELAIKNAVRNLQSCIENSDDRMVNEGFNALVQLIQNTPTYHIRETDAKGKGSTRRPTDAEAKAMAMEVYQKYTGRNFAKDVKDNCDPAFWTGVGNFFTLGALDNDCASSILDNGFNREGGKVAQKTGGTLAGAGTGAAIGACVAGPLGAAIGGAIGGVVGFFLG